MAEVWDSLADQQEHATDLRQKGFNDDDFAVRGVIVGAGVLPLMILCLSWEPILPYQAFQKPGLHL
jgi:hypothetical protein